MNNVVDTYAVQFLSEVLSEAKVLSVYEYNVTDCDKGYWTNDHSLQEAVLETFGLAEGSRYEAKKDGENFVLNAAVFYIDFNQQTVKLVSGGTHLIEYQMEFNENQFGLSGGFDTRNFTLNKGDFVDFSALIYAANFNPCASMSGKTILVLSDSLDIKSVVMG